MTQRIHPKKERFLQLMRDICNMARKCTLLSKGLNCSLPSRRNAISGIRSSGAGIACKHHTRNVKRTVEKHSIKL